MSYLYLFLQNVGEEPTEEDRNQLLEILSRDRLHEMSEQEKELVWRLRQGRVEGPELNPEGPQISYTSKKIVAAAKRTEQ